MRDTETLYPEQAASLLHWQETLQAEAQTILANLDLIERLAAAGSVRLVSSAALGLMVWRDIDISVSCPGLSADRAVEIIRPFYSHPWIKRIRYLKECGQLNPTGLETDERFYFGLYYQMKAGDEWKIDVSFWLCEGQRPEPVHDALVEKLTPDRRLAILWLKELWHRLPAYRSEVYSVDIYDAVLEHDVRTPEQFDTYLIERGKPSRPGK